MSRSCRFIFAACLALALAAPHGVAALVTKQGRQLLVDGQPFTIKGVCYSPVPAGYNWTYAWGDNSQIYDADLRLIKAMGANTVRTYQERNITRGFLDAAQRNGLYVIIGWTEELWDRDFSTQAARDAYLDHFETFVNTWKDHPAVLMWCFGNEQEEHTLSGKPNWYLLLNQAADRAHAADAGHLVTTANQELFEIGFSSMNTGPSSSVDVWGVNVYRGSSFGQNYFTDLASRTTQPYYLSEWGCDAYNGVTRGEDRPLQDTYIRDQWQEIAANLVSAGKTCSGGTLFEWCDEWWKGASSPGNPATIGGGGVYGPGVQDTASDWTNGSYDDDSNMNEEWWGIVSIKPGTVQRTPRLAFYTLRDFWGGSDVVDIPTSSTALFQSEVRNYPNPFAAGAEPTRIEFTVSGSPAVEIAVFDLAGRKVGDVPSNAATALGTVTADWSGRDENGSFVPAGLYVCRVKARTAEREEIKYRKIAVVK